MKWRQELDENNVLVVIESRARIIGSVAAGGCNNTCTKHSMICMSKLLLPAYPC